MSRGIVVCVVLMTRFPRVSGDEPTHPATAEAIKTFSPRERG